MTLLPSLPDLNPSENLWAFLKWEINGEGKQYTSLNSVWEAEGAAAQKVDKLTSSMLLNRRVVILVNDFYFIFSCQKGLFVNF